MPRYIVDEINALGGNIQNAYGISIDELKAAIPCGIGKINVDTDIRLAVTRNMKEFFHNYPEKRNSPSIGGVYKLLEEKKDQFDPRAFLPPIMDTVMYGNVPDEDVAALVAVIAKAEAIVAAKDSYVSSTLNGLEEALAAGKAVNDNPNALQDAINNAVTLLPKKLQTFVCLAT